MTITPRGVARRHDQARRGSPSNEGIVRSSHSSAEACESTEETIRIPIVTATPRVGWHWWLATSVSATRVQSNGGEPPVAPMQTGGQPLLSYPIGFTHGLHHAHVQWRSDVIRTSSPESPNVSTMPRTSL